MKNNKYHKKQTGIKPDAGFSNSFFLFLSLLIIIFMNGFWNDVFGKLDPVIQFSIAACLIIFIAFSMLSSIYSIITNEPSVKHLRKSVIRESKKLETLIREANSAIEELENQLKILSGIMHPNGIKNLKQIKAILYNLNERSHKAKSLVRSRNEDDIIKGYNIFFSNVDEYKDATTNLILEEQLPSWSYDVIPSKLTEQIKSIEECLPRKSSHIRFVS